MGMEPSYEAATGEMTDSDSRSRLGLVYTDPSLVRRLSSAGAGKTLQVEACDDPVQFAEDSLHVAGASLLAISLEHPEAWPLLA